MIIQFQYFYVIFVILGLCNLFPSFQVFLMFFIQIRIWIKLLKHSKYLFIWSGRFQISTINSRTSLFQVEGSDVGHDLVFKFFNYLIIVFLCNFCYFRFRLFISFFQVLLILFSQIRVLYAFVAALGFLVSLGYVFTI